MNLNEQDTRPQPDNTRRIPLTQGQFAIVDVEHTKPTKKPRNVCMETSLTLSE